MSKFTIFKILILFNGLVFGNLICFSQDSDLGIDFRYSPSWWQTLICFPDDPVKTLVGKEGQLFGDFGYPGPRNFSFSLKFGGSSPALWKDQQLKSPRVPVLHTIKESDGIQIDEQAFLEIPGKPHLNSIERFDGRRVEKNWSRPFKECDAAFNDIASGKVGASGEGLIEFQAHVKTGSSFDAVLGFCEGKWDSAGKREMRIYVEGAENRDIDPAKDFGFRVPGVYTFHATDVNRDGILTITVTNKPGARDRDAFVNAVWLYNGNAPAANSIIAGKQNSNAVVYAPASAIRMPERRYHILAGLKNPTASLKTFSPLLYYEGIETIEENPGFIRIGNESTVTASQDIKKVSRDSANRFNVELTPVVLKPGEEKYVSITLSRFYANDTVYRSRVPVTKNELIKSIGWWQKNSPSAAAITIPDQGIQSIVEAGLRNIFQARDIRKGKRSFNVGPTEYRGLWIADGSFLLEVATMFNYVTDVRSCIESITKTQLSGGGFEILKSFYKENGLVLFLLTRHALLTQDKKWLADNWSVLEGCIKRIRYLRSQAMTDSALPGYTLLPPGFVDGGITFGNDYSNVEGCLSGMKWAIRAAKWIGKDDEAADWQREYDDFYSKFITKAAKDIRKDDKSNLYLPVMINNEKDFVPQKGQWSFCQSVYPGMLFEDDSTALKIAKGTLDMLADHRTEGLVFNTGWMKEGIWTYFTSFFAHALLWMGRGNEVAPLLYDFGNHASPTMVWREEQKPKGKGDDEIGDMPHNWASAEFIRMVVHMIQLDHGNDLYLFEGFPEKWARAGAITRLNGIRTPFGRINLSLVVNDNGTAAKMTLKFLDKGNLPAHIMISKQSWIKGGNTETLKPLQNIEMNIPIK